MRRPVPRGRWVRRRTEPLLYVSVWYAMAAVILTAITYCLGNVIWKPDTGALVGIAIDQGCIPSVDEPMMTYFPELEARVRDPRLDDVTIEQLLQMRAGYPWEESSPEGVELLYGGFRPSNLLDVPLVRDPGTGWDYSNLSAHIMGMIVARAADMDLMDYAQSELFGPLGIDPGDREPRPDGGGQVGALRARGLLPATGREALRRLRG